MSVRSILEAGSSPHSVSASTVSFVSALLEGTMRLPVSSGPRMANSAQCTILRSGLSASKCWSSIAASMLQLAGDLVLHIGIFKSSNTTSLKYTTGLAFHSCTLYKPFMMHKHAMSLAWLVKFKHRDSLSVCIYLAHPNIRHRELFCTLPNLDSWGVMYLAALDIVQLCSVAVWLIVYS